HVSTSPYSPLHSTPGSSQGSMSGWSSEKSRMVPHSVSVVVQTRGGPDASSSVVDSDSEVGVVDAFAPAAPASVDGDENVSSTEPSVSVGTGSEASRPASVTKLAESSPLGSASDVDEVD